MLQQNMLKIELISHDINDPGHGHEDSGHSHSYSDCGYNYILSDNADDRNVANADNCETRTSYKGYAKITNSYSNIGKIWFC